MLGHRQLGFEDYKLIVFRRWWIVIAAMCAGTLVGYAISRFLPKIYTSQTLLAIEPPNPSDAVVKTDFGAYLVSRLSAMQEQVFGEAHLQQLALKLGLIHDNAGQQQIQAVAAGLRTAVTVAWAQSPVSTGQTDFPGFEISCGLHSPQLAQQACRDVASMFIEENQAEQQQRFQSATAFVDDQLDDAKRKLDQQEAKAAAFKQRHAGELPERAQTDPNTANMLSTMDAQLERMAQSRRDTEQEQTYTRGLLDQKLASLQPAEAPRNTQAGMLEQQLDEVEKTLVTLRARYTGRYPEIVKLESQAEDLKRQISDSFKNNPDNSGENPRPDPPEIQQLRNKLHTYDQQLQDQTQEETDLQKRIKLYESRLEVSPAAEQEYLQVTRDYQSAQDFYNDLLKKKHEAEMASDLQHRREQEEIVVVNAATFPQEPSSPNTLLVALAGLGLGGALGVAWVLLMEIRDKSLRTEGDVELLLRIPVAVAIPSLDAAPTTKRGHSKRSNGKDRSQRLTLNS